MRSLLSNLKRYWLGLLDGLTFPGFLFVQIKNQGKGTADQGFVELNDGLIAQRVMAERVRVFADRSFEAALTAPLGTLLLAWVGGSSAGWLPATIWFLVFTSVELVIVRLAYLYRREGVQKPDVKVRARHLIILSFLVGLGWGSSVWLFWVPGQLDSHLLNLLILVGVAAVALVVMFQ